MKKSVLGILLFVVWILLVWPFGENVVSGYQDIVVGIIVSLFTAYIFGDAFTESPHKFLDFKRYLWMVYYIPVFLYYCILANLDVAYRILHPAMPIRPGIVKVKTRMKSRSGLTALANSITLTPGTMSVDITSDGYIYVHWIYVKAEDMKKSTEIIVRRFERILERIYE